MKLIMFDDLDLNGLGCAAYGTIKWHPIVIEEINGWSTAHSQGRRHRKVDKYGIDLIRKALRIARSNAVEVITPTKEKFNKAMAQYLSEAASIKSNSADPKENDCMLLYHSIEKNIYMMTNDDIVFKLGKKLNSDKSIQLEHFLVALCAEKVVTKERIKEFDKALNYYQEYLNSWVYSAI